MDDKDNIGATKDPSSDSLVDKKLNFFLKTEDLEEVTDLPIFSPTGAGTVPGSGFQSFQTTQGGMKGGASADGWSNASLSLLRGSRPTSFQDKLQQDRPVEKFLVGFDRRGLVVVGLLARQTTALTGTLVL
jgi:hypothetical protein